MFKQKKLNLEDVIRQSTFYVTDYTIDLDIDSVLKKRGLRSLMLFIVASLAPIPIAAAIDAVVSALEYETFLIYFGIVFSILLITVVILDPMPPSYVGPRTERKIVNAKEEFRDFIEYPARCNYLGYDIDPERLAHLLNNNEHVVDLLVIAMGSLHEGNASAPREFVELIHEAFHDEVRKLTSAERRAQLAQQENTARWDALRDLIRETTPNNH